VKFALVTDLGVLLRFELKQIASNLQSKKAILVSNIEDLGKYVYLKENLDQNRNKLINEVQNSIRKILEGKTGYQSQPIFTDNNGEVYFDEAIKFDAKKLETFTKENQTKIERYKKVYDALQETQIAYDDKKAIKSLRMFSNLIYTWGLTSTIDVFVETLSKFTKIQRTIFEQRGYSENTDISIIKNDLENELLLAEAELTTIKTPEFENELMLKIQEQKEKYAVKGGSLQDRVNDFSSLNYVMSYRYKKAENQTCEIPKTEAPVINLNDDRARRLKLAKAKALALKLKLKLAA
jgi:hypothetical protein